MKAQKGVVTRTEQYVCTEVSFLQARDDATGLCETRLMGRQVRCRIQQRDAEPHGLGAVAMLYSYLCWIVRAAKLIYSILNCKKPHASLGIIVRDHCVGGPCICDPRGVCGA